MMETEQRVAAAMASGRGVVMLAVAVMLMAAAAAGLLLLGGGRHRAKEDQAQRMAECRATVLQQMGAKQDMDFLQSVHDLCYNQVRNEEVLTEFEIRKNAYRQQQAQGPWLLGLVLVITMSGVLLAAVQLFWGYKLSVAGKATGDPAAGTFSASATGVSVSSTVTGVLILALSFAFFYIFIQQVYVVHEPTSPPVQDSTPAAVPTGTMGTLQP